MKIKTIEYGESVQTSYDTWKKLSLTAELEEGDKEEEAINKLQSRVSEFMKKQTEIASVYQFKSPQPKNSKEEAINNLIAQIQATTTLEKESGGLYSFQTLVGNTADERLTNAYTEQLNKLQKQ